MRWMAIALIVLSGCVWGGCAPIESGIGRGGGTTANPGAAVTLKPLKGEVEIYSNRDDEVKLDSLELDVPASAPGPMAGMRLKTGKFEMNANASDVRDANTGQIVGMGEFNLATGRAWSGVIDSIGTAASSVIGQVLPQTGAWAFRSLFLMIGIPVAAVFAVVVGVCGLLVIVIVLMIGWNVIRNLRKK